MKSEMDKSLDEAAAAFELELAMAFEHYLGLTSRRLKIPQEEILKAISAMVPAATPPPPPDDEFTGNGIYHYHVVWHEEAAVDSVEVKISIPFNEPSCDCGAKAVGSEMHSHWCTMSKLDSN